jgi:hypothetical protein
MDKLRIAASVLAGLLLAGPLLAGLLLAGLLLAGCAGAGPTGAGAAGAGYTRITGAVPVIGHLAGRLVREGGPLGPGGQQPAELPLSGTVTFTAAGHRPVTVKAGSSGAFSAALPPGRYRVSGRSPAIMTVDGGRSQELPCSQPASATVIAGRTASMTLACVVP